MILIGDVCDWHAISFHSKHPEAPGPKDEYELARLHVHQWHKAFPKARVCVGNHDARVVRTAEEAGIPACLIRNFADAWGTPGWKWDNHFTQDDVYYFHGTGTSGIHPAFNSMCKLLMSVVQGHIHSAGGIKWRANPLRRIFGMDVGCGIDDRAYAFAYGRDQKIRSILSAGVVIDGIPHHEVMAMGPGEKYHRSRFTGEEDEALFAGSRVRVSRVLRSRGGAVPDRGHDDGVRPSRPAKRKTAARGKPGKSSGRGHKRRHKNA